MTSDIESPLRFLAESSPRTHLTASITLDFPQPLGPTTATKFVGKEILVLSTKLLKPASLICLSCIEMKNLLRFILNYCEFTNQSFSLIFTPNIALFLADFLGNNEEEKLKLFWQFNREFRSISSSLIKAEAKSKPGINAS